MGVVPPEPPVNPKQEGYRHCPMCGFNNIERLHTFWQVQRIMRCKDCGFKSEARKFYRLNPFGVLGIFDEVELP